MTSLLLISTRKLGLTWRLNNLTFLNSPFRNNFKTKTPINQNNNYEINTNVVKDVILFKYENPTYFKMMNLFSLSQLFFWTYLGIFSYSSLRDIPALNTNTEGLPWWRKINFGDNKNRLLISSTCFFIGYMMLAGVWIYTLKTVRFLILNKGGTKISLVTYTPFGKNRIMTVPLDKVSCTNSRHQAKAHLALRIAKHRFNYMLDMRGTFSNPILFDHTAGLKRIF